jgi:hypothetical protein
MDPSCHGAKSKYRDVFATDFIYLQTPQKHATVTSTASIHYSEDTNKMVLAARSESFDQLLRKGPVNGDLVSGLDELRYKILIDGIPSNSDGMVSSDVSARTNYC